MIRVVSRIFPLRNYPLMEIILQYWSYWNVVQWSDDEQSEWYPDIDDKMSKITDKTKAIVIINPVEWTLKRKAVYPKEILEQIRADRKRARADHFFRWDIWPSWSWMAIKGIFCIPLHQTYSIIFQGLSKSHMIAGFRIGWMILSGAKNKAKGYIEGIKMLSSMRLCSNVPAQSIVQTALGGYQSVNEYIQPGGSVYEQRDFIYKALNDIRESQP